MHDISYICICYFFCSVSLARARLLAFNEDRFFTKNTSAFFSHSHALAATLHLFTSRAANAKIETNELLWNEERNPLKCIHFSGARVHLPVSCIRNTQGNITKRTIFVSKHTKVLDKHFDVWREINSFLSLFFFCVHTVALPASANEKWCE